MIVIFKNCLRAAPGWLLLKLSVHILHGPPLDDRSNWKKKYMKNYKLLNVCSDLPYLSVFSLL